MEGNPGIHWVGGWVGPTAGLETRRFAEETNFLPLPGIETRLLIQAIRLVIYICEVLGFESWQGYRVSWLLGFDVLPIHA
jgi:hypothetical protein